MNSLHLLGDNCLYASHYLIEKDKLIYSKIIDLYFNVLKAINRFNFFNIDCPQRDLIANMNHNNFWNDNLLNNDNNIKKKEKQNLIKNYNMYQSLFNTIIANLIYMFLGVKNITEKSSVFYNYTDDTALINFSKRFFYLIKSCFEKYSKYINSGHNYDLIENILNLFSDYSILFGFKYNIKGIQNRLFSEKLLRINFSEEEFLYDIIELLKNSCLSKYSESLQYAYRNAIEI